MIELILYYGNSRHVINRVIETQALLPSLIIPGDTDRHGLGDGYYFHSYAWQAAEQNKNKSNDWAVLQCKVHVHEDSFMDYDLPENRQFFSRELERLKAVAERKGLSIASFSDISMCNHLSNILELELVSKSFSRSGRRGISYLLSPEPHESHPPEKQYCILNPKIASDFSLVTDTLIH